MAFNIYSFNIKHPFTFNKEKDESNGSLITWNLKYIFLYPNKKKIMFQENPRKKGGSHRDKNGDADVGSDKEGLDQ